MRRDRATLAGISMTARAGPGGADGYTVCIELDRRIMPVATPWVDERVMTPKARDQGVDGAFANGRTGRIAPRDRKGRAVDCSGSAARIRVEETVEANATTVVSRSKAPPSIPKPALRPAPPPSVFKPNTLPNALM